MDRMGAWKIRQEEKIDEAIAEAKALFLSQGVEKVTMNDIAQRANIGVASLYRYPATATKTKILIAAGTSIWKDLFEEYGEFFESNAYRSSSGYERIKRMLSIYIDLYQNHRDFISFLTQFDAYCLVNEVSMENLAEYEKSVLGFYQYYEEACKRGVEDGTVRNDFPIRETYFAVNHSMMSLVKKLSQGAILSGDVDLQMTELNLLIDIFLCYVKNYDGGKK